jgi:hypothetical protein
MKTEKEIEEMAVEYCLRECIMITEQVNRGFKHSPCPESVIVFTAGAHWMQKDLLESASEGFEEWFTIFYKATPFDSYNESIPVNAQDLTRWQKEAWQAAKLSNQKIIQEKDEKIAELEESLRIEIANHKELVSVCESYREDAEKYEQAVKDISWLISKGRAKGYLPEYAYSEVVETIKDRHGISEE